MFITIEGVDGAGKSTQLVRLEQWLRNRGMDVLTTREPGGTPLGESIREILKGEEETSMHDEVELMLIFTARLQHLKEVIQPAVESGKCVICDRFTDATYAYQGGGRGISDSRIIKLEQWVQGEFQPDLTLVFDLPVETGADRIRERGEAADRFERQGNDFKQAVRQVYLARARKFPERIRLISAAGNIEQVCQDMLHIVDEFLELRKSGRAKQSKSR